MRAGQEMSKEDIANPGRPIDWSCYSSYVAPPTVGFRYGCVLRLIICTLRKVVNSFINHFKVMFRRIHIVRKLIYFTVDR
jgi:hypothetical protein